MTENASFSPDWISHPGETIEDLLEERGWTRSQLAERMGFTRKHVNELLKGRASLTPDTAVRLASVLGSTPQFWLVREARYRAVLEERERLDALIGEADWLEQLPLAFMRKRGWVARRSGKGEQVSECLAFFAVASPGAWTERYGEPLAASRTSPEVDKKLGAVTAWLRRAELQAESIRCADYDGTRFQRTLEGLRALTLEKDPRRFIPTLTRACADAGVAVVFVPAPPGCPASGAARWLTTRKALLAFSLGYRSDHELWFAFFHGAAHVKRHGKKRQFVEGIDGLDPKLEAEADAFARDLLLPPSALSALADLAASRRLSKAAVRRLAEELGIAPGIVVGRLQQEGWLPSSHLHDLKVRYRWSDRDCAARPLASEPHPRDRRSRQPE